MEFSDEPGGVIGFQLGWRADSSTFYTKYTKTSGTGGGTFAANCPTAMPSTGLLCVTGLHTSDPSDASPVMAIKWYNSEIPGFFAGTSPFDATMGHMRGGDEITSTSSRWAVLDSVNEAPGYTQASKYSWRGSADEVAVWARDIGIQGFTRLVRNCKKPYDDVELMNTNPKVVTRVVIEDGPGANVDLSNLNGVNYIKEISIDRGVDEDPTASITLNRKIGYTQDLAPMSLTSPNNLTSDFVNYINVRTQLRIEKAVLPHLGATIGYEWETIFQGLIDSWDFNEDTINIKCSDLSAGLSDVFLLDAKAHNFYTTPKFMEYHIQDDIIKASLPKQLDGTIKVYKGAPDTPTFVGSQLWSKSGFAASYYSYTLNFNYRFGFGTWDESNWALNYNDVPSGDVYNAIQSVAEQIGGRCGFEFANHANEYRLTLHVPDREKEIKIFSIQTMSGSTAFIETFKPHGLIPGSVISGYSLMAAAPNNTFNNLYTVLASTSPYKALIGTTAALTSGASLLCFNLTSGTHDGKVMYRVHDVELGQEHIQELAPFQSDVDDIRNWVSVKYNRSGYDKPIPVSSFNNTGSAYVVISSQPIGELDPDGNGVAIKIEGCTSTATPYNGTWTGSRNPNNAYQLYIGEPVTGAPAGIVLSNGGTMTSDAIKFEEYRYENTDSQDAYGIRSCGIYEGSSLGIDSEVEAAKLAQGLIHDLAQPVADASFTSQGWPIDLNDLVKLPVDPKMRYSSNDRVVAVTGIREIYSSGVCRSEYTIRLAGKPTGGRRWTRRVIMGSGKPGSFSNNTVKATDIISGMAQSEFGSVKAISTGNQPFLLQMSQTQAHKDTAMAKPMKRNDQTVVYMSTGSAGFIPERTKIAGTFRSENISLSQGPDNAPLRPGVTHYVKLGQQDVFKNMSQINGFGAASSATVWSFVPRFTQKFPGAFVTCSAATTLTFAAGTYTPCVHFQITSGSDPLFKSFDTYGNFNSTSQLFKMPCDGVVMVSTLIMGRGTNAAAAITGRVGLFDGSMATKMYTSPVSITDWGASSPTFKRGGTSWTLSASSGDLVRFEVSAGAGSHLNACNTASASFSFVHYSVVSQN
jgi:hypothetical protein